MADFPRSGLLCPGPRHTGAGEPMKSMKIRVLLESQSLLPLLAWWAESRFTGSVTLWSDRFDIQLRIRRGRLLELESSGPRSLVAHELIRRGWMTPEQFQHYRASWTEAGSALPQWLVARNLLSEDQLATVLREKMRDLVFTLRLSPEFPCEWWSDRAPEDEESAAWTGLPLEDILAFIPESESQWARFLDIFPAMARTVLAKREDKNLPSQWGKDLFTVQVYRAIDGRRSLADIARLLYELEYDVLRAACVLYENEWVSVVEESIPEPGVQRNLLPLNLFIEECLQKLQAGEYDEAANLMDFIEHSYSELADKLEHLRQLVSMKISAHYRTIFPPEAVPVLTIPEQELTNYRLDPMIGFLATRINGIYEIRILQNLVPVHEGRFYQMLKKLCDLGIVSILPARSTIRSSSGPKRGSGSSGS